MTCWSCCSYKEILRWIGHGVYGVLFVELVYQNASLGDKIISIKVSANAEINNYPNFIEFLEEYV